MPMTTPRRFEVPKALCAAGAASIVDMDDLELLAYQPGDIGAWAGKVLARENQKILDEIMGDDTHLPRGVLVASCDDDAVEALVNSQGQVWSGTLWEDPEDPVDLTASLELDEADTAFIARAFWEGYKSVVMKPYVPLAFVAAAEGDSEGGAAATAAPDVPEGAVVVAVVDMLDKSAVLEAIAVAPGPKTYRRHDGQWVEDPAWVEMFKSVSPPPMVKLEQAQIASVQDQIDGVTAGQPFELFEIEDRDQYVPAVQASAYLTQLAQETEDQMVRIQLGLLAVAGRELSPKDVKNTERLKRYWTVGPGAAKIRWMTPGSWTRCHRLLSKYMRPNIAAGYCTNIAKRLGGHGVATHVGDD